MGMVALKCPACGADIQLDDSREFGFCNFCGTKVIQDKIVVEHTGAVTIDKSTELKNLRVAAHNAMAAGNTAMAMNHLERISIIDPNCWETVFFPLVLKSDSITNGQIMSYSLEIRNSFDIVFSLIKNHIDNKEEQVEAINEVIDFSYEIATMLMSASLSFRKTLNKGKGLVAMTGVYGAISSAKSGVENINEDRKRALSITNIMWVCGDKIEAVFDMEDSDFNQLALKAWKNTASLNKQFINTRNSQFLDEKSISRLSEKIKKYESPCLETESSVEKPTAPVSMPESKSSVESVSESKSNSKTPVDSIVFLIFAIILLAFGIFMFIMTWVHGEIINIIGFFALILGVVLLLLSLRFKRKG